MDLLFATFFFALGAIVASFVGVLVERLNTGHGIVRGRSRCDACGEELQARDLVPLLSFCICLGWSRCCRTRVSPRSTILELLLGTLYVLAYMKLGFTPALLPFLISLAALAALVLYDLRHTILPPQFLAVFLLGNLGFALSSGEGREMFLETILVALGIALFFAVIHFASSGRAMGLSDAPLAFGLGLLVAPHALSGFVFSFWIGALVGITLLVRAPKGARMGIEVPFAPFLACGFLLAYFTSWDPFVIVGQIMTLLFGV